jgi:hypothetical protein
VDELKLKRMERCAKSPEGHDMIMVDWDEDIAECQFCGMTIKGY